MQILLYVTVLLDVPPIRQIVGFLYLALIPGLVILRLLGLKNLHLSETVLLAAGLSIAFLMFAGLCINHLGLIAGQSRPLSLWPSVICINVSVLVLCLLGFFARKENRNVNLSVVRGLRPLHILPILLPVLGVAGAVLVNISQNNLLLLSMIVMVSALFVFGVISERSTTPGFYSLLAFLIGISLLLHASLATTYIRGWDINVEYYSFKVTRDALYWDPASSATLKHQEYSRITAMLSTTVLPTVFAEVLNVSETAIFQIVYPLIYAFVPLGLYKLYEKRTGKRAAFLSAFLYMATSIFFMEMLGLARQMIGTLFFVLLFYVLMKEEINSLQGSVLFLVFGAALVVSHYSLSYIFMFYLFFTWLFVRALNKKTGRISASVVVMFFVVAFSWYIYVSDSGVFNGLVNMSGHVVRSTLTEFFNLESRGGDVLRGLGMGSAASLWHSLGRIFAYATELLIVIGFVALVAKEKKNILTSEHHMFLLLSMILLGFCIVLPSFAETLRMPRYYHTLLILLAPMCILGSETVLSFLRRKRVRTQSCTVFLALIVIVPYFLFQTGFVYEITGDSSWSIPLSEYRMGLVPYAQGLIDEQDVYGALWLSDEVDVEKTLTYADDMAKYTVLTSYAMIRRDQTEKLSNTTTVLAGQIVYLRKMNLDYGVLIATRGNVEDTWNITEISPVLEEMNLVYSNGGCEIYQAMYNQTSSR